VVSVTGVWGRPGGVHSGGRSSSDVMLSGETAGLRNPAQLNTYNERCRLQRQGAAELATLATLATLVPPLRRGPVLSSFSRLQTLGLQAINSFEPQVWLCFLGRLRMAVHSCSQLPSLACTISTMDACDCC
jgi:hypothetical protein